MSDMVQNPFATPGAGVAAATGGATQQARESAEILALYAMAERFRRDPVAACDRIRNAFTRPSLAAVAEYQFARGGTDIKGPSIRSAEACAQQWGNMSNGWREIARWIGPDGVGVSEVEAWSTDLQSRNREAISFVVRHWRDTRQGGYALKDERDIYEMCANQAQRRKRACILANIPGDVIEMAMDQVAVTLTASADTSPEAVAKLVAAFEPFGVRTKQIEAKIQRRLEAISAAQIIMLRRIYVSLRDDMSQPADWFEFDDGEAASEPAAAAVRAAAAAKKAARKTATPTPTGAPPASTASAATTGSAASATGDGDAGPKRTLAQYTKAMTEVRSGTVAALILDEARDDLTPEEQAELGKRYTEKFGGGDAS